MAARRGKTLITPNWLPELIKLNDYDGDWKRYIEAVFAVFYRDFIESQPKFKDLWVRCRRDPIYDGKEAGFWHCTSDGLDENHRIPDLRRCERIAWIRTVIDNYKECTVWANYRSQEKRWLIWLNEEFLVVLAERERKRDGFKYMQLITSYCTIEEHRKAKLQKERDEYYKSINS